MQVKRHDVKSVANRSNKLQKTGQQVLGGVPGKRINVQNMNEPPNKATDVTATKAAAMKAEWEGTGANTTAGTK